MSLVYQIGIRLAGRCIFITEASEQFTSAAIMCAKDMIDLIL